MLRNVDKIKKHLFSLTTKGIKYDLERISRAAQKLDYPQNSYKIFHIAGTNGKGSTCFFIESILRESGFRTGLFTSPHIINFEERFRINGSNINEKDWLNVYEDIHLIIEEFSLTFFEAVTLIAFELFRRSGIDYMICETGLGGRLDATNIVKPVVSVITAIAMDHQEYLGDTITDIAFEKAGIIKPNIPVVTINSNNKDVIDLITNICEKKKAPCNIISKDPSFINKSEFVTEFYESGYTYKIKVPGEYQVTNALLAIEAVKQAEIFDYKSVYKGLSSTHIPGRFHQIIIDGKTVIFDVGHNCQAANALVKAIKTAYAGKSVCIVTGIMKDKDVAGILQAYSEISRHIVLSRPCTPRAESPEKMRLLLENRNGLKISTGDTIQEAVSQALRMQYDIVCICGSFYTVGEAFNYLKIKV